MNQESIPFRSRADEVARRRASECYDAANKLWLVSVDKAYEVSKELDRCFDLEQSARDYERIASLTALQQRYRLLAEYLMLYMQGIRDLLQDGYPLDNARLNVAFAGTVQAIGWQGTCGYHDGYFFDHAIPDSEFERRLFSQETSRRKLFGAPSTGDLELDESVKAIYS